MPPILGLVRLLLDLIAPETCIQCRQPGGGLICPRCRRSTVEPALPPLRVGGVPVLAAAGYAPPVSIALHHFKYRQRPDLARPLAALVCQRLLPDPRIAASVLVPVPLHPQRQAQRGYNQSALLARRICRVVGARCAPRALERTRDTPQLAGRAPATRAAAVGGAFAVRDAAALRTHEIVLVDDVVTTGATAAACIEALQQADIGVGAVLAVATAQRRRVHVAATVGGDAARSVG